MAAVGFVLVACGARSEIAGGGGSPFADASIDAISHDAAAQVDVSPIGKPDGAAEAGSCTVTVVGVGCAGPNGGDCVQYGCKFNVEWTCGDVHYRSGGACAPPDAGPWGGSYQGVCDENGMQTSTFNVATMTCDCEYKEALATLVQGLCTHQ